MTNTRMTLVHSGGYRDHWKLVHEDGRIMSTGTIDAIAAAAAKHWPDAIIDWPDNWTPGETIAP